MASSVIAVISSGEIPQSLTFGYSERFRFARRPYASLSSRPQTGANKNTDARWGGRERFPSTLPQRLCQGHNDTTGSKCPSRCRDRRARPTSDSHAKTSKAQAGCADLYTTFSAPASADVVAQRGSETSLTPMAA